MTCITGCNPPRYLYEEECVDTCPQSARLSLGGFKPIPVYCVASCPEGTYRLNNTCYHLCPSGYSVYNRSECVSKCHVDAPYREYILSNIYCVPQCYKYYYKANCTETCPKDTVLFKSFCLDHCRSSHPFVCDQRRERLCRKDDFYYNYMDYTLRICVEKCPTQMQVDNRNCVSRCPLSKTTFKNTCLDSCPSNYSYKTPIEYDFDYPMQYKCVSECPHHYFTDNYTCVKQCTEYMYSLELNRTCVNSCPKKDYVVFNRSCLSRCHDPWFNDSGKCVVNCSDNKYGLETNRSCITSCPLSEYVIKDKQCLTKCPASWFNNSGMCVKKCPKDGFASESNRTCIKTCPLNKYVRKGIYCLNKCPEQWLNEDGYCVQNCSVKRYILEVNKTCVDSCTLNRYVVKATNCLNKCPDSWYNDSGICLKNCSENFIFNGTCFKKCPLSHRLLRRTVDSPSKVFCLDKCPNKWLNKNGTCVEKCPGNIVFNNTCINVCPSSHPYIKEKYNVKTCTKVCDGDDVVKDGTCISHYKCDDELIIYQGKCLTECPGGFIRTIKKRCERSTFYVIVLLICISLILIWVILCWKFFTVTEKSVVVIRWVFCFGSARAVSTCSKICYFHRKIICQNRNYILNPHHDQTFLNIKAMFYLGNTGNFVQIDLYYHKTVIKTLCKYMFYV